MNQPASIFGAVFAVLYIAHQVGDHWLQTEVQAVTKGAAGWLGRLADTRHVATLTALKLTLLLAVAVALHIHLSPAGLAAGLGVDAVSHWWADRRFTLKRLCQLVGKADFYALGAPREGHDDNPGLGGAYQLDQSWHVGWLLPAALLIVLL